MAKIKASVPAIIARDPEEMAVDGTSGPEVSAKRKAILKQRLAALEAVEKIEAALRSSGPAYTKADVAAIAVFAK